MGMKRNLGSLLSMYTAMAISNDFKRFDDFDGDDKVRLTEEEKIELRKRQERTIKEAKGLHEFIYGDNIVWALNQKNADKKAKRKGYI